MKKISIKNYFLIILLILIMVEGFLINGCLKNEKEILTPVDSPKLLARVFLWEFYQLLLKDNLLIVHMPKQHNIQNLFQYRENQLHSTKWQLNLVVNGEKPLLTI